MQKYFYKKFNIKKLSIICLSILVLKSMISKMFRDIVIENLVCLGSYNNNKCLQSIFVLFWKLFMEALYIL